MIVDIFVLFIFGIGSMAQKVLQNNGGGNGVDCLLTFFATDIVEIECGMCADGGATLVPQLDG